MYGQPEEVLISGSMYQISRNSPNVMIHLTRGWQIRPTIWIVFFANAGSRKTEFFRFIKEGLQLVREAES